MLFAIIIQLMKAIIQRVASASVIVDEKIISSIGRGICVLIGIGQDDVDEDIEYIVRKLLNLRLFDNQETGRRWDKSVKELNLEVLSVSQVKIQETIRRNYFLSSHQFTLHACIKGNKLDFHRSMGPEDAPKFYAKYMDKLKKEYQQPERIKDGLFGAMMTVQITNEGPVTIKLDSKKRDD
jgi:D-tyrosyl-tRNA(Tyr) deacylase